MQGESGSFSSALRIVFSTFPAVLIPVLGAGSFASDEPKRSISPVRGFFRLSCNYSEAYWSDEDFSEVDRIETSRSAHNQSQREEKPAQEFWRSVLDSFEGQLAARVFGVEDDAAKVAEGAKEGGKLSSLRRLGFSGSSLWLKEPLVDDSKYINFWWSKIVACILILAGIALSIFSLLALLIPEEFGGTSGFSIVTLNGFFASSLGLFGYILVTRASMPRLQALVLDMALPTQVEDDTLSLEARLKRRRIQVSLRSRAMSALEGWTGVIFFYLFIIFIIALFAVSFLPGAETVIVPIVTLLAVMSWLIVFTALLQASAVVVVAVQLFSERVRILPSIEEQTEALMSFPLLREACGELMGTCSPILLITTAITVIQFFTNLVGIFLNPEFAADPQTLISVFGLVLESNSKKLCFLTM